MYENLIFREDGAIATIQLHRPQKKNSLNGPLRAELEKALAHVAADNKIRVVVITGGNDTFCAGADIAEIEEARSPESAYKHAREFQTLFDRIENLPQPVIAAVSGHALGGGCELALACDFRIASETARFGLPEIKIGAFPAGGGTQRLPRLIGIAKAKEIIFTGDAITAEEALSLGLVTKVVPKERLLEEANTFAWRLASLPRLAMEASKMLINKSLEMDVASGLELEARSFGALATTHDLIEGTKAFLEKRRPNFTGD
ncbi:MAG TPA: enoyl-CoA hydratase/isomerase family protein [Candidatus Acidoferrales bacterium]|nr:enoyl-CoA hydratase/isomerase family protein [Candidatus Acidoferrales bacterium]